MVGKLLIFLPRSGFVQQEIITIMQTVMFSGQCMVICSCPICILSLAGAPIPVVPILGTGSSSSMFPLCKKICVGDPVGLPCGATVITGATKMFDMGRPVALMNSMFTSPTAKFALSMQMSILAE